MDACRDLRLLVIGDLMLDRYLWGRVERISPEAPVPVVDIQRAENRPGGAANVALNLVALGAKPLLCGLVGSDADGDLLLDLATKAGFDTRLLLRSATRRTTLKVRIIGNGQQVLRVDQEDRDPLTPAEWAALQAGLAPIWEEVEGVILQDYDKALLASPLIQAVLSAAAARQIPVVVDPKFRQFHAYAGCTLFKPNLKELNEGLGLRLRGDDRPGLESAIRHLRQQMPHAHTLVTLGGDGMLLVSEGEATHFPAHRRAIADVSGAGDTVISVMGAGLAAGLPPSAVTYYANLAGGLVCEAVGVVPLDPAALRREAAR